MWNILMYKIICGTLFGTVCSCKMFIVYITEKLFFYRWAELQHKIKISKQNVFIPWTLFVKLF